MIYLLVLANALVFFLSKYGHVSTTALYLNHRDVAWYQLLTATFCHANIQVSFLSFQSQVESSCLMLDLSASSISAVTCFHCWFSVGWSKRSLVDSDCWWHMLYAG